MGSLKDAIKEKMKQEFQHIVADTLVLWKVSISDVSSLLELSDINFANEESLLPMDKLSKVFLGVPKEGYLHIIVKPPIIATK